MFQISLVRFTSPCLNLANFTYLIEISNLKYTFIFVLGESLSKQLGKHSEVIKKLRSKEKSSDKELKNLRERIEDKTKECDRLSKSLEAKNEVESKQIEAIQNLTTANTQWEENNNQMSSDLEDANEKVGIFSMFAQEITVFKMDLWCTYEFFTG